MKDLYLLTTGYPYPAKSMETYLETEVKYYANFRSVKILSMGVRKKKLNQKRKVPGDNIEVYPIIFGSKLYYIWNGFRALIDINFYKEIYSLAKCRRLTVGRLVRLIIYVSRSHTDCKKIIKSIGLKKDKKPKEAVLYAYRFEYQPYVMCLLEKYFDRPKMVARAHRYDLYEERNNDSYIPMRSFLLKKLERVYLISEDGRAYLDNKFPKYKRKLSVSRLGTLDMGQRIFDRKCGFLRIVSCSNIVPVKRIDLIIEALSQIKDIVIEWIHFGSGEKEQEIKKLAEDKLIGNIRFMFKGNVPNEVILEYYRHTDVDLFINLSKSEGIPVSIMEAMSFGVPCIATDVGGTNEIVKNYFNGYLLQNGNIIANAAAEAIRHFNEMPAERQKEFREHAREYWDFYYNADKNYRTFVAELLS